MAAEPIREFRFSSHALAEMGRRAIAEAVVRRVLAAPEQRFALRPGRDVLQARTAHSGRTYLVRVIVDVDRRPAEIVTVYRTGKLEKYWRRDP
ncbi:MAG: DUF4258 domain-containing protein [Terriglobales bacterium]|jgi:hypothetical protein